MKEETILTMNDGDIIYIKRNDIIVFPNHKNAIVLDVIGNESTIYHLPMSWWRLQWLHFKYFIIRILRWIKMSLLKRLNCISENLV